MVREYIFLKRLGEVGMTNDIARWCEAAYVMMKATIWERTKMGIAGMCRYCLMVGKYG